MKILIDTRIWALGLKAPFLSPTDPSLSYAALAQAFLRKMLRKKNELLFSSQLTVEIFHVLTQRGTKIPAFQARRFVTEILSRGRTLYRPVSQGVLERCMQFSAESGIHIWDYLVSHPFEDGIDKIYTLDPHFQHRDFQNIAQVENPIGPWKTEGQEL